MRQFSLAAVTAEPAVCAEPRRRTWPLLDIAMTIVMLGMTSVFVGTLALSLT